MATFHFRLTPVLRYRTRIREARQWELQALEGAKAQVIAEIRRLEQLISQQTMAMEEQQGKVVSVLDLRLQGDFFRFSSQKIQEHVQFLTTIQRKLEEKRKEVARADQEVKSLEQLQVRLWDRHRQQEKLEEQKLIDEVGQRQYAEKKNAG
ncbi:MAG: flagellar export protein FliJ [Candidatus Binatia bacterium]